MASSSRVFLGETLGAFVLVAVGTSSVALAVVVGTLTAAWQVAAVWGVGVALAIVVASPFSRAHLNPAVTTALALARPGTISRGDVARSLLGQLLGAVAGALVVWAVFGARLAAFESAHGLVRGAPGSERAAMIFGEYFPNPAGDGAGVSTRAAFLAEAAGTAALMLAALVAGDVAASRRWPTWKPAALVGATVAAIILVVGPMTQAGLNPARDFGPRLVAWIAGYGDVAIPGPHGGFWIYLAGPIVGATATALAYEKARGLVAARRAGA